MGQTISKGEKLAYLENPIDPKYALKIEDRNKLFEPGYLDKEVGYCQMPDGSTYVANLTKMPGVTVEMFDWWFAWHGLGPLRYTLWDPYDHYHAISTAQVMCHFVREIEGGIELRTRFWTGYHIMGGNPVLLLKEGEVQPLEFAKGLLAHNMHEFANLADLLPRIYPEEKDNWY